MENKNKIPQYDDVYGILNSGDFSSFMDSVETAEFEGKTGNWGKTIDDKWRSDLAKKIGGFYNSDSGKGILVIGLISSKKTQTENRDRVVKLDLLEASYAATLPNIITGILKTMLYPKPKSSSLTVNIYPSKGDKTKCLVAIEVNASSIESQYFIVKIDDETFKIPIRSGDDTLWLKADDIYKLSRRKRDTIEKIHSDLLSGFNELKNTVIKDSATKSKNSAEDLADKMVKALRGY